MGGFLLPRRDSLRPRHRNATEERREQAADSIATIKYTVKSPFFQPLFLTPLIVPLYWCIFMVRYGGAFYAHEHYDR